MINIEINKLLTFFNHDDPIYKSVISDKDGVPEPVITKPTDYHIGAIADVLEWNRHLTLGFLKQIFLNTAEGKYLDDYCYDMFGMYRNEGETDAEYSERVRKYILSNRLSPASIIVAVKDYSGKLPEIIEGQLDAAFADITYSDVYVPAWQCENPLPHPYHGWWVFPAIPTGTDGGEFYFILIVYNMKPEDAITVVDIVNTWKASGVGYHIEVRYD